MKIFSIFIYLFCLSCGYQELEKSNIQFVKATANENSQIQSNIQVSVVDATTGEALPEAFVIMENSDYSQTLLTNEDGLVEFPEITNIEDTTITITIAKKSYTTTTLYQIYPETQNIQIPLKKLKPNIPITLAQGTLTKWQKLTNNDGKLDFGLFLPHMSFQKILTLDPSNFFAPSCHANLAGDRLIPCNIVIPRQKEFLFVVFEKENYIMPLPSTHPLGIMGISFQAPIKPLANAMETNDVFEIFKQISLRKLAVKLSYLPNPTFYTLPLEFNLKAKLKYITKMPPNSKVLHMALLDIPGRMETFIPTGFAIVEPNSLQGNLSIADNIESFIPARYHGLSLATRKNNKGEMTFSVIINRNLSLTEPVTFKNYPEFFNISVNNNFKTYTSTYTNNQNSNLSISRLMRYTATSNNNFSTTCFWEIIAPSKVKAITLPDLPQSLMQIKDIIDNLSSDDSLHFARMYLTFSSINGLQSILYRDFLPDITRTSWAETIVKRGPYSTRSNGRPFLR